jgi:hypothetical protein
MVLDIGMGTACLSRAFQMQPESRASHFANLDSGQTCSGTIGFRPSLYVLRSLRPRRLNPDYSRFPHDVYQDKSRPKGQGDLHSGGGESRERPACVCVCPTDCGLRIGAREQSVLPRKSLNWSILLIRAIWNMAGSDQFVVVTDRLPDYAQAVYRAKPH